MPADSVSINTRNLHQELLIKFYKELFVLEGTKHIVRSQIVEHEKKKRKCFQ